MSVVDYLGIGLNEVVITLGITLGVVFILLIVCFINIFQNRKLKKKYNAFMTGNDGSTLEETITRRLDQIDSLVLSNEQNRANINRLFKNIKVAYQKVGMVKYDAFSEMGGKLSFTLALLNDKNNGFILNAMHSREGCYTYIKEILDGNSIIVLSDEEKEALNEALGLDENKITEN